MNKISYSSFFSSSFASRRCVSESNKVFCSLYSSFSASKNPCFDHANFLVNFRKPSHPLVFKASTPETDTRKYNHTVILRSEGCPYPYDGLLHISQAFRRYPFRTHSYPHQNQPQYSTDYLSCFFEIKSAYSAAVNVMLAKASVK